MEVTPDLIASIAAASGRPIPELNSSIWDTWVMWAGDAAMLIEDRLGNLDELDQAKLYYVVREAVAAQVRRPDDETSVDISVDDGRVSRRYASSSGRVAIRDEWWRLLDRAGSTRGAFVVDTYAGGDWLAGHADVCNLRLGAVYCSCGASLTVHRYPLWEGGALS